MLPRRCSLHRTILTSSDEPVDPLPARTRSHTRLNAGGRRSRRSPPPLGLERSPLAARGMANHSAGNHAARHVGPCLCHFIKNGSTCSKMRLLRAADQRIACSDTSPTARTTLRDRSAPGSTFQTAARSARWLGLRKGCLRFGDSLQWPDRLGERPKPLPLLVSLRRWSRPCGCPGPKRRTSNRRPRRGEDRRHPSASTSPLVLSGRRGSWPACR